jgi:nitroreductase
MENSQADQIQPIDLPQPVFNHCVNVFEALKSRRTFRAIGAKPISLQLLADILWAAQGINRVQGPFGGPGRTAGSASNAQEIRIYVALGSGIYLLDPEHQRLTPVAAGDSRALVIGAGQGGAGANAPVRLIYVVDLERFQAAGFPEPGLYDPEIQKSYYYVDTGLIAQNVYLAAASLGLASWFHNCNRTAIEKKLGLKPDQHVLFGQTVGYFED